MISDADIIICEDGKPLQAIPELIGDGEFHVAYSPKAGHTYKFMISKDNFKTIEAETTILPAPAINSLEGHLSAPDKYGYYNGDMDINLCFTDKTDEENFYLVKADVFYPEEIKDMLNTYWGDNDYVVLSTSDNIVSTSYSSNLFFCDELLNGSSYNLKFKTNSSLAFDVFYIIDDIRSGYLYIDNPAEADSTAYEEFYEEYELKLAIHFSSISKDYYQYLSSLDKYNENDGNPFAEPTLIKTNITNGLGMLGSCSETIDTVKIIIKNPNFVEE